jgi:hypothetical protein
VNTTSIKSTRPWELGAALLLPGAFVIAVSLLSDRGVRTNPHDPGPWFLPLILGTFLCLGAIVLLGKKPATKSIADVPDESATGTLAWQFLAGLLVFLWAMPWVGFLIATPVFSWLLLFRLRVNWWQGLAAAVGLTLAAYGLFAGIFKVPLPAGIWD